MYKFPQIRWPHRKEATMQMWDAYDLFYLVYLLLDLYPYCSSKAFSSMLSTLGMHVTYGTLKYPYPYLYQRLWPFYWRKVWQMCSNHNLLNAPVSLTGISFFILYQKKALFIYSSNVLFSVSQSNYEINSIWINLIINVN